MIAVSAGGMDLLLHLLSNITQLPVTKSIVKDSGMGKAIGSIEKHKICAGSPNESAVKERVKKIKAAWNQSVKALNDKVQIAFTDMNPHRGGHFIRRANFDYRAFRIRLRHLLQSVL